MGMNYIEIKALALSYADRDGSDTAIHMDGFMRIVEARINRNIRVAQMATRSIIYIQEGQTQFGLPSGFLGIRDIEVREPNTDSGVTATYINPEQMNAITTSNSTGNLYYTILANQIQLSKDQSGKTLEIVYYKSLTPLAATTAGLNTWLSIAYPDCYVFGLLVEIESFVKNALAAEMWDKRFRSSLLELEQSDQIDRWSGTPLTTKVG